ncbi:MAG: hypothetical protein C0418_06105 [Coriobacteriaceae bacterium]|nr:hypothetical protein [Coriobacteriaceae bacterium]
MVRRATLLVLVLALSFTLGGCAGGQKTVIQGGGAPGGETSSEGPYHAEDYKALTAGSANEKSAVKNIGKALASYIKTQEQMVKQNKSTGAAAYVFRNEPAYEPLFVGHQVSLFTGKKANGKFGSIQLVVLDGKVTVDSVWERAPALTRDNGLMTDQFFTLESEFDAASFTTKYTPQSANEKAAVTAVEKWAADNVADLGFKEAVLTGYTFIYGQPEDQPKMIVTISPEGQPGGSVVTAPEEFNKP